MEFDALAQMKGVGEPVGRNIPALGEPGLDIDRARLVPDQAVVDRRHDEAGAVVQHGLGVESRRIGGDGDDQRLLRPRARGQRGEDQRGGKQ
jgi:hypothetical protein